MRDVVIGTRFIATVGAMMLLLVVLLLSGCATAVPVVYRTRPPQSGMAVATPPPVVEEDPVVAQARAIGQRLRRDRERWDAACLELRKADFPYSGWDRCRQVLGERDNGGRYIGGAIIWR